MNRVSPVVWPICLAVVSLYVIHMLGVGLADHATAVSPLATRTPWAEPTATPETQVLVGHDGPVIVVIATGVPLPTATATIVPTATATLPSCPYTVNHPCQWATAIPPPRPTVPPMWPDCGTPLPGGICITRATPTPASSPVGTNPW